ncbi:hypothetical protein AYR56_05430 [Loigolactobacillus backii]|uniref:BppU N-terminal domain-containing protein n=1 Tax=Loigolactobacillus backii TaxID=375175 RepID=A0A192H540_9LACO|nr:BppU family phage baseplate upper protein [Loigolactobacillus backii]ANK63353.1 hypothetical protein AYR53_11575 [Loigolactobacillus backii]ANK69642.1 hypothetical protein AYR56_05430 [Loigolactobacillus backii]
MVTQSLETESDVQLPIKLSMGKGSPKIIQLDNVFSSKIGDNQSTLPIQLLETDMSPYNLFGYSVNILGSFEDGTNLEVQGTSRIKDVATGQVDLVFPANCFSKVGRFNFQVQIDDGETQINSMDMQIMVYENHYLAAFNTTIYQDRLEKLWSDFKKSSDVQGLETSIKTGAATIETAVEASKALQAVIEQADLPTKDELNKKFDDINTVLNGLGSKYSVIATDKKIYATLLNTSDKSLYCCLHVLDFGSIKLGVFAMNCVVNESAAGTAFAQFPKGTFEKLDGTGFLANDVLADIDNKNDTLKTHRTLSVASWACGNYAITFDNK